MVHLAISMQDAETSAGDPEEPEDYPFACIALIPVANRPLPRLAAGHRSTDWLLVPIPTLSLLSSVMLLLAALGLMPSTTTVLMLSPWSIYLSPLAVLQPSQPGMHQHGTGHLVGRR